MSNPCSLLLPPQLTESAFLLIHTRFVLFLMALIPHGSTLLLNSCYLESYQDKITLPIVVQIQVFSKYDKNLS